MFSKVPLARLLGAGLAPAAQVLPHPGGRSASPRMLHLHPESAHAMFLSQDGVPGILQLAAEHSVPVLEIGSPTRSGVFELVSQFQPDVICVSCFPYLLPDSWLALPPLGCMNLHPSLLPAYRGPAPLFWQFRNGEKNTGVTLHFMARAADAGDIIAQRQVELPEGGTTPQAERLLAEAGAELLIAALSDPASIVRTPQSEAGASYHPAPEPADKTIPAEWEARRAYQFMRGAQAWGPFIIKGKKLTLEATAAVALYPAGIPLPGPKEPDVTYVRFARGVVAVRVGGYV